MHDSSVTEIIKNIEQPYGGLLPVKLFHERTFDGELLECIMKPIMVGKVVDALLHEIVGTDLNEVFKFALTGYRNRIDWFAYKFGQDAETLIRDDKEQSAYSLLRRLEFYIQDNDWLKAINYTFRIFQYEEWNNNFTTLTHHKDFKDTTYGCKLGDAYKIHEMVLRTFKFMSKYGNVLTQDLRFYPDGYSDVIKYGVGDFLVGNTIFDLKCTKNTITSQSTLQVLVYYCMAKNSGNKLYESVKRLGLFSPVTNTEWIVKVEDIPAAAIDYVEKQIIQYS